MAQRHRRRRHLLNLWGQRAREERERILAAAALDEEAERRAARQRVLGMATSLLPVVVDRRAPLLTRGQADRSRHTNP